MTEREVTIKQAPWSTQGSAGNCTTPTATFHMARPLVHATKRFCQNAAVSFYFVKCKSIVGSDNQTTGPPLGPIQAAPSASKSSGKCVYLQNLICDTWSL